MTRTNKLERLTLTFFIKAGVYPSGAPFLFWESNRQGRIGSSGTNGQTYSASSSVTKEKKSFITLNDDRSPGLRVHLLQNSVQASKSAHFEQLQVNTIVLVREH